MSDRETVMHLRIDTIRFESDRSAFRDTNNQLTYTGIEDSSFLERVRKGEEEFRKGDVPKCRVRIQQWGDVGRRH